MVLFLDLGSFGQIDSVVVESGRGDGELSSASLPKESWNRLFAGHFAMSIGRLDLKERYWLEDF